ncbi:MAG: RHS repeat-associated core domain-containing protein [Actinomycetota bacterium]
MSDPEQAATTGLSYDPTALWAEAADEIQRRPVTDRALGERYTILLVASKIGRGEIDYQDDLNDPTERATVEEWVVGGLGERGDQYRSIVHETLEALASGRYGYLPDPLENNLAEGGDPLVLFNGEFHHSEDDLVVRGAGIDFVFRRTYRNQVVYSGPLGANWDHIYNVHVRELDDGVELTTGELRIETYRRHAFHSYFVPPPGVDSILETRGDSFVRRAPDGRRHVFERDPGQGGYHRLAAIEDRHGNALRFAYRDDLGGVLGRVTINHPARFVHFQHDQRGRILSVSDHSGRTWRYEYDDMNDLVRVSAPEISGQPFRAVTHYEYDSAWMAGVLRHNLARIIDGAGREILENVYGTDSSPEIHNRIVAQRQSGTETLIDYEAVVPLVASNLGVEHLPAHATLVCTATGHQVLNVFNRFGNLIRKEEWILEDGRVRRLVERHRYNRAGQVVASLSNEGMLTQNLYLRDSLLARPGLVDDDVGTSQSIGPTQRLGFSHLLGTIRRGRRFSYDPTAPSSPVWGDLRDPRGLLAEPGDIAVRYTYESDYSQLTSISDPRYTTTLDPDTADPHPRHARTLTRYFYDGPTGDSNRLLTAIERPTPTLPDGTAGAPVVERFVQSDGSPAYDNAGRLLRHIEASGTVTEHHYAPLDPADPRSGFLIATIRDAEGLALTTTFEVDGLGRTVATVPPRGADGDPRFVSRTEFDALDRPSLIQGPGSRSGTTRYEYDPAGPATKIIVELKDESGQPQHGGALVQTFRYDQHQHLVREQVGALQDPAPLVTRRVYGGAGQQVLTIRPQGTRTRVRYDARLLAVSRIAGAGTLDAALARMTYDGERRVRRAISPSGNVTTSFYDTLGNLVGCVDPTGVVVRRDYDSLGNVVVERVFQPTGSTYDLVARTETDYDELGRAIRHVVNIFEEPLGPIAASDLAAAFRDPPGPGRRVSTESFFDASGRLEAAVDGRGEVTEHRFDPLGRLVETRDPSGDRLTHEYDNHDNLVRSDRLEAVRDGAGAVVEERVCTTWREYDEFDRLAARIDSLGNVTRWEHDSRGVMVLATDPIGRTTRFEVDVHGRPVETLRSVGSDGGSSVVASSRYEHDLNGNLVAITDAEGRRTELRYDALDRRRSVMHADGAEVQVDYDADGNIVRLTQPSGLVHHAIFDGLGKQTRIDIEPGPAGVPAGPTFAVFEYDALGRQVVAENDYSRVTTRRNSAGWPVEEICSVSVPGNATPIETRVTRDFDETGAVVGVEYPGGRRLVLDRDSRGRVARIRNVDNGAEYPGSPASPSAYELMALVWQGSQPRAITRHAAGRSEITYDAGGRVLEIAHSGPAGSLLRLRYLCDGNDNVALVEENDVGGTNSQRFDYDRADRLVGWGPVGSPAINVSSLVAPAQPSTVIPSIQTGINALIGGPSPDTRVTLSYDRADNRVAEQLLGQPPVSSSIDPMDQVADRGGRILIYDADGNLSDDGVHRFAYDAWCQLAQITDGASGSAVARYFHDARGRRVLELSQASATVLAYDGEDVVAELEQGRVVRQCVRLGAGRGPDHVAERGSEYWPCTDVVGSPRLLLDYQGRIGERFDFDPFGQRLSPSAPSPYRWLFGGRRVDNNTGTYDHGSREYDPTSGRYLQRDPAWPGVGAHPYVYARANPMRFHDPSGLAPHSVQSRWVFFVSAQGVEFTEETPTPWGSTRDMLREQGFHVLDMPWNQIRTTAAALAPTEGLQASTGVGSVREERSWLAELPAEIVLGYVPPSLYRYAIKDFYLADHVDVVAQTGNAVQRMADRAARRWGAGGARELDYWANAIATGASAPSQAASAVGGAMNAARAAGRAARIGGRVAGPAAKVVLGAARRMATGTDEFTRMLFRFRNEAVDQARQVAANAARAGIRNSPRQFGNIADAVFKAHVLDAIDQGLLPETLVVTARFKRGPDVINTVTGEAWDLTTATVRQVAQHDISYIGAVIETRLGPVRIADVLPLVYTR